MSGTLSYARQIQVTERYDAVVCGGGPSGFVAALAAAREGLKVLLIESQAQLGGMATSGLVSQWLGGRTQEGDWVIGGLFRSLSEEAVAAGCALLPKASPGKVYHPYGWMPWFLHGISVDSFALAEFLDRKMLDAGVEMLFETQAVDVRVEKDRITHLIVNNKSGLQAIPTAMVIDATGDADIAALGGCPYELGRTEDNLTTVSSLMFHVSNVNGEELVNFIEEHKAPKFVEQIKQLRAAGEWPFEVGYCLTTRLLHDDEYMLNTTRLTEVCGTDAGSRSAALIQGRRECFQLFEIMRRHFPGFTDARMKAVASALGVRETRRILGDFRLTVDDVKHGRQFEDTIGFSMFGWDLPDPKNPNKMPFVDISTGRYVDKVEKPTSNAIPYRIMVPRQIRNLLCPGRAASVERDVLGTIRVMGPCMAMGEAAGVAAGKIVQNGSAAGAVDTAALREKLRSYGVIVDPDALPYISPRVDPT
jgi:hypothetical protein